MNFKFRMYDKRNLMGANDGNSLNLTDIDRPIIEKFKQITWNICGNNKRSKKEFDANYKENNQKTTGQHIGIIQRTPYDKTTGKKNTK